MQSNRGSLKSIHGFKKINQMFETMEKHSNYCQPLPSLLLLLLLLLLPLLPLLPLLLLLLLLLTVLAFFIIPIGASELGRGGIKFILGPNPLYHSKHYCSCGFLKSCAMRQNALR